MENRKEAKSKAQERLEEARSRRSYKEGKLYKRKHHVDYDRKGRKSGKES